MERFVEAFNTEDAGAMVTMAAAGFHWMSVSGDVVTVEAAGRDQLRSSMEDYFANMTSVCAELRSVRGSGPFVQTVEEVTWRSGTVEKRQCSMAIYEIGDGKILNVWYFPAYACP